MNFALVVALCVWLLQVFGLIDSIRSIREN